MSEKEKELEMENNDDVIVLVDDETNEEIEFIQDAIIPYEDDVYAFLIPLKDFDVNDYPVYCFKVQDEEDGPSFEVIDDDELLDKLYSLYDELIESENKDELQ